MRWFIVTNMLSASICLHAQTIENVDFRAVGKMIVVSYDFLHPKADTSINVALVFKAQQGGSIVPKSISGDIKNVKPGEGKRINWDVLADGITLSGKYNAEVSIKRGSSVKIGSQVWSTENLNVDRFRNGDPIPQAKTDEEWINASKNKKAAWCYYENDSVNYKGYGKLYNWYAVTDTRGLAPSGWHVPSAQDWIILVKYVCGNNAVSYKVNTGFNEGWQSDVSYKLCIALKSKIGWLENGRNTFGFNALPGLMRIGNYSLEFWSKGTILGPAGWMPKEENIQWWTSSDYLSDNRYAKAFLMLENTRYQSGGPLTSESKDVGLPIRCIKD
jgi:uncharacterized protein (TIGR02145 family)